MKERRTEREREREATNVISDLHDSQEFSRKSQAKAKRKTKTKTRIENENRTFREISRNRYFIKIPKRS